VSLIFLIFVVPSVPMVNWTIHCSAGMATPMGGQTTSAELFQSILHVDSTADICLVLPPQAGSASDLDMVQAIGRELQLLAVESISTQLRAQQMMLDAGQLELHTFTSDDAAVHEVRGATVERNDDISAYDHVAHQLLPVLQPNT
jgi:hypothetical protein